MKNQFTETLNIFKSTLEVEDFNFNTYWNWMFIPDNLKAAALYVQYYDQITLAWRKTKKPFMEEETAVSTLMQYLMKNVDIIKENPKRYTPNYIYKVAFNAFYPLGRIKRDIDEWSYRTTGYEVDLELVYQRDEQDYDNLYYTEPFALSKIFTEDTYFSDEQNQIWSIINACDKETKKVIEYLIGGKKLNKKLTKKMPEIILELKIKLKKFYPKNK